MAWTRVRWAAFGAAALVIITLLVVNSIYGFDWLEPSKEDALSLTGSAVADRIFYDDVRPSGDCSEFFDQVCGSDGETYRNLCQAHAAGANMRHRGAC